MPYLKRNMVNNSWPIPRKGTKYLASPGHNQRDSIPLIVAMREVLGLVKNKKELKKAINEKQIKINGKEIKETNYPICLFDILRIGEKNYKTGLSDKKKFKFEEIGNKEADSRVFKVISRKMLSGKKVQLNLMNGINILSNEKVNIGDSIVYNFKDKKIEKVIAMEKGKSAVAIRGKHTGVKGKIENIIERGGKGLVKLSVGNSKINVWTKNIIVVE